MSEWSELVYDRVLDVTAVLHIPLKIFTIAVVISKTSSDQRNYSYFILNSLIWNLLANLLFTFGHLYPTYPAMCFRLDGPARLLSIDNETVGHVMFIAVFASIGNVSLAMLFAFPYRYMIFAHPHYASRIEPSRVVFCCGSLHMLITMIFVAMNGYWVVSYDDYQTKHELPGREFLFCFHDDGARKYAFVLVLLTVLTVVLVIGLVFSVMLFASIYRKKGIVHHTTLRLQKKMLNNLIVLTSIPGLVGGVPLVICVILVLFPYVAYAQPITLVCIVMVANHGTVYAVASLLMFQSYRQAVKDMFCRFVLRRRAKSRVNCSLFLKVNTIHGGQSWCLQ